MSSILKHYSAQKGQNFRHEFNVRDVGVMSIFSYWTWFDTSYLGYRYGSRSARKLKRRLICVGTLVSNLSQKTIRKKRVSDWNIIFYTCAQNVMWKLGSMICNVAVALDAALGANHSNLVLKSSNSDSLLRSSYWNLIKNPQVQCFRSKNES